MSTDYYLHNFHVKTGKGTLHSMKGYQRAFGVVDWNEDDDGNFSTNEKDSSAPSVASSRLSRNPTASRPEDSRIANVRRRCAVQNQALSSWWKVAIQSNIQQRMWMQLSRSPAESLLPPRFERYETLCCTRVAQGNYLSEIECWHSWEFFRRLFALNFHSHFLDKLHY